MRISKILAAVAIAWTASASGASSAVVSGSYYEDVGTCSTSSNVCVILFPPLSSATLGKYVLLDEISCTGSTTNPLVRGYLYVSDNGTNLRRYQGLDVPKSIGAFSFTAHKNLLLGGGVQLLLFFEANDASSFDASCTMVGKIVTNP